MTPESIRKLHILSRQLTEHLMSAALCAREIDEITQDPGTDGHNGAPGANGNGRSGKHAMPRPLVDEATLSVIWRGRSLHLGHTKCYWLLARLARRSSPRRLLSLRSGSGLRPSPALRPSKRQTRCTRLS